MRKLKRGVQLWRVIHPITFEVNNGRGPEGHRKSLDIDGTARLEERGGHLHRPSLAGPRTPQTNVIQRLGVHCPRQGEVPDELAQLQGELGKEGTFCLRVYRAWASQDVGRQRDIRRSSWIHGDTGRVFHEM